MGNISVLDTHNAAITRVSYDRMNMLYEHRLQQRLTQKYTFGERTEKRFIRIAYHVTIEVNNNIWQLITMYNK